MSDELVWELLDQSQFPVNPCRAIDCGSRSVKLKPYQAVVWVSLRPPASLLAAEDRDVLATSTPILPALLDSGFNDTFSVREDDLKQPGSTFDERWIDPDCPKVVRYASGGRNLVPNLQADIWLRTENTTQPGARSHRLPLGNRGIAYYPTAGPKIGMHISAARWERFLEEEKKKNPDFQPVVDSGPPLPMIGLASLAQGLVRVEITCSPIDLSVSLWVPRKALPEGS